MDKNKPAFIIIGAAGFIGSAFSSYLKQNNFEVFDVFRGQISGIALDFHFIAELMKIENKQLVVVDFAYTSVPNTSFKDPVKDFSENLYNVIRHLEFAKQLPGASYLYISSGGTVYGNSEKHQPIDEKHPNNPVSPYGITKLACEKYVLMYKEIFELNVKIVRPSNVYGPGQKPFRGQGFVATAVAKTLGQSPIQIFGNGSQVRDYLYIDDFCELLLNVIQLGENGFIYNSGSGIGYSLNEILQCIKELVGLPVLVDFLPYRPFDVEYNVLDSSIAAGLNNWRAKTSLIEGLKNTVEWIQGL